MTYCTIGGLGFLVAALAIFPPDFLQYVIAFTITVQASAFLFPIIFALLWHRANWQGKLTDMLVRFSVLVGLHILGWADTATKASPAEIFGAQLQSLFGWLPGWGKPRPSKLAPLIVWGMEPLVWGFASSLCAAVGVALAFPLRKETDEV